MLKVNFSISKVLAQFQALDGKIGWQSKFLGRRRHPFFGDGQVPS
jgi:hypothetical protein